MSTDVGELLRQQKRRRRLAFWLGFLLIAVVGAAWAGLSKEPIGPDFINDGVVVGLAEIEDGS